MAVKTYTVIIKVEPQKFVKYRNVSNFRSLYIFLDKSFPLWTYGNVFGQDKLQKGSFTKNRRLTSFN